MPFADGFGGNARPRFIIERSRDDAGVANGSGITFIPTGGNNMSLSGGATNAAIAFCAVNYADPSKISWGLIPVILPGRVNGAVASLSTSIAAGAIGPVFPWIAYVSGTAPWQCISGLTYPGGDAPSGIFTVYNLGVQRTYRAIPIAIGQCGWGVAFDFSAVGAPSGFNTHSGLASLWE